MRNLKLTSIFLVGSNVALLAQASQQPPPAAPAAPQQARPNITDLAVIPLWEGAAPGALGSDDADKPTLTLYRLNGRSVSGTAVIVAPAAVM